MVGGYCSTFRRAGFTFDASTHFYPLLGNPDTISARILSQIGDRTQWVPMDPVDTFHLPDGVRFDVPADFSTYRASLDRLFPHQTDALNHFFAEANRAYLLGTLYHFRGRRSRGLDRLAGLTLDEVLQRTIDDPKLRLFLTADIPHWGSSPEQTSFVFDSMLRLSYFLGNYYPKGGSQAFVDGLAQDFEAAGGEIAMSTRAERILVHKERIQGVELKTLRGPLRGEYRVESPIVVSNADLRLTLNQLLPPGSVPDETLEQTDTLRPSDPCFLTHLGLRGFDQKRLTAAQGYYWKSWDYNQMGRGALRLKVFSPTLYDPDLAPAGSQILILQKVITMDSEGLDDPQRHKMEVERFLLGEIEGILPGISQSIEHLSTASAQTAERFTLNHKGAMLGWQMAPDQIGNHRPGVQGHLPGLYYTGHWVRPGGGITPVIVSAQHATEAILGDRS